jgi:hypothetical protein
MPKFTVIVTRDVTESAFLTVEADDEDKAHALAMEKADAAEQVGGPILTYERDECATSDPYITGCNEEE